MYFQCIFKRGVQQMMVRLAYVQRRCDALLCEYFGHVEIANIEREANEWESNRNAFHRDTWRTMRNYQSDVWIGLKLQMVLIKCYNFLD